jgi:O-methyltransferase
MNESYIELLKGCLLASLYEESAWRIYEPRSRLRSFITKLLAYRNFALVKLERFDPELREDGRDWPMFGYTMIGRKRLNNIEFCVREIVAHQVPGDLVETGVWRGGAVIFMKGLLSAIGETRTIWACGSFEGMPVPKGSKDGVDLSYLRYLAVSVEQVQENFRRFGLLDGHVKFLKGWFCDTLANAPIDRIALLRLDGDLYSSTMDVLTALYHKVSPGGYVIVDDYGSWPECKRAVHDFIATNNLIITIREVGDGIGAFWQVL